MATSLRTARSVIIILAVGYLRRSTKGQKGSISDQRTAIERYAAKPFKLGNKWYQYKIVRWYIDDGISGDDTEKRYQFLQMRDDASSGTFQAVICWDQDRFGRFDSMDAGYYCRPFRQAGVYLVTLNDGKIDWEDFAERMTYSIKQEGAKENLIKLSRGVLRGQMEAAAKGSVVGAAPYAYKIIGEKKAKTLVINDAFKVSIVRRIFDEYDREERTMNNIANRLNAEGIDSPGANKQGHTNRWRSETIKVLLSNEAYIGTYTFNKFSQAKYHHLADGEIVKGKRRGLNPESDWIVTEKHHEAIILACY